MARLGCGRYRAAACDCSLATEGHPDFPAVTFYRRMRQAVNHFQGQAISNHIYAGGAKGSWFVSIAVGLAGLVCVVVAFFVLLFAFVAVNSIHI
jgi:hypothetical protein